MRQIHWIGAGLSSTFGIDALASQIHQPLHLWMRRPESAAERWKDQPHLIIHPYDLEHLRAAVAPGDILVSMLPYILHVPLAQLAIACGAHFVCSSYLSNALLDLDQAARSRGVVVAGEMGLDPGIDHMLTHELVRRYRTDHQEDVPVSLISLCGGIPAHPGPFKYAFSWSPLGILRALRNSSTWLEEGKECSAAAPYQALRSICLHQEEFVYYPNRDSLAFVDFYQLPRHTLRGMIRGSIRPAGWESAWRDIFNRLPQMSEPQLEELSQELFAKYAYQTGEHDRVVMYIALQTDSKCYSACIDVVGNDRHHAMTTLVCIPLLTVIEGIQQNLYDPGVLRPLASPAELNRWLQALSRQGIQVDFRMADCEVA